MALNRTKAMTQSLRLAVLLGWFVASCPGTADAGDIRARLAQKDFTVEASVRMMVVLTAASGQQELATCMHDHYFGSPLLLRRTLWRLWNDPYDDLESALLANFKAACAKEPPKLTASDRETWLRTGNDAILLEPGEGNERAVEAAAAMLAAFATERGDQALVQCVADQRAQGQLNRLLSENHNKGRGVPISLAVYDAYRKLCGLYPDGPAARDLNIPLMPDIATVARERLKIVQDFLICQSGIETNMKDCILRAYQARAKRLFNQLLSSDSPERP